MLIDNMTAQTCLPPFLTNLDPWLLQADLEPIDLKNELRHLSESLPQMLEFFQPNSPLLHRQITEQIVNYLSTNKHMQKVASTLSSRLLYVGKQSFGRMLMDAASNPIKERVVSTAQWPVPYYQRIYKAYPVRQDKKVNLSARPEMADDYNWWSAKNILNESLKGRQLVEHTENNIKTNTYLIKREDCETMARAYVDDISQFISMANRENVRILSGKTMI